MNINLSMDAMLSTVNVGIFWIVFFCEFTISPKMELSKKQKAYIYGILSVIAFVVATSKTVVIFDIVIFAYYIFSMIVFYINRKK